MKDKYLFLDFDGVLHGVSDGDIMLFHKAHYIEELQKEFPNLKVILSTDWQISCIFEQLQKYIPNIKIHHCTLFDDKNCYNKKEQETYISRYDTILDYIEKKI